MSMEEQHLRELEAIANSLPADPFGMGQLRLLLGSLPAPTQPEVKSAREGAPDVAPGGSGIGNALSLTSSALPGGESSAVLGALPELFYGQSNLLANPALNGIQTGVLLNVASTIFPIAPGWDAFYDLNSGSISSISHDGIYERGNPSNPMASAWSDIDVNDNAGAAYNLDFYIEPSVGPNNLFGAPTTAHLVAACRVWHSIASLSTTDFPSFYAVMEIVDYTDTVVLAESTPFDLRILRAETTKISCAVPMAEVNSAHDIRWRLRVHVEKAAGVTTPDPFLTWGEPQLTQTATQAPPPYTPQLGRWYPDYFEILSGTDTDPRLSIGTGFQPDIRFGPGNANQDVKIERSGAEELTISTVIGGPASLIVASILTKPFLSVASVNIDADQNNWNPAGLHDVGLLRASGLTANRTITGLDAGTEGEMLVLNNDSATFSLILSNDNVASTDVNRFRFAAATSITVRTRGMVLLIYNNNRWRAIAE